MSFEGRYQLICKNGHYTEEDVYSFSDKDKCLTCKEPFEWKNMVDDTNGYEDGYIKVKLKSKKKCEHCKTILEEIYHIPKKT